MEVMRQIRPYGTFLRTVSLAEKVKCFRLVDHVWQTLFIRVEN